MIEVELGGNTVQFCHIYYDSHYSLRFIVQHLLATNVYMANEVYKLEPALCSVGEHIWLPIKSSQI